MKCKCDTLPQHQYYLTKNDLKHSLSVLKICHKLKPELKPLLCAVGFNIEVCFHSPSAHIHQKEILNTVLHVRATMGLTKKINPQASLPSRF